MISKINAYFKQSSMSAVTLRFKVCPGGTTEEMGLTEKIVFSRACGINKVVGMPLLIKHVNVLVIRSVNYQDALKFCRYE